MTDFSILGSAPPGELQGNSKTVCLLNEVAAPVAFIDAYRNADGTQNPSYDIAAAVAGQLYLQPVVIADFTNLPRGFPLWVAKLSTPTHYERVVVDYILAGRVYLQKPLLNHYPAYPDASISFTPPFEDVFAVEMRWCNLNAIELAYVVFMDEDPTGLTVAALLANTFQYNHIEVFSTSVAGIGFGQVKHPRFLVPECARKSRFIALVVNAANWDGWGVGLGGLLDRLSLTIWHNDDHSIYLPRFHLI